MKIYTLDEVQDKLIGSVGTKNRDQFEYKLKLNLIKKSKKSKNIEELDF